MDKVEKMEKAENTLAQMELFEEKYLKK